MEKLIGSRSSKSFRRFSLVAFALVAFSTTHTFAQNGSAADEAKLRENVRQMESGWNGKSGALFAKPFAEDADYVVINGRHIKGRNTIAAAHQQIFDTIYKDTRISLTVKQIRFLRRDVALVLVSGRREGPASEIYDATMTMVMTKDKGRWTIAAFQNTAVAAN